MSDFPRQLEKITDYSTRKFFSKIQRSVPIFRENSSSSRENNEVPVQSKRNSILFKKTTRTRSISGNPNFSSQLRFNIFASSSNVQQQQQILRPEI
ncbi:hypothetical protein TorRG33x02_264980 [Trema orientale]|uniref:Uncharacterized protein n=1 Tax=Trema orientale TaxID=63057 RepID=A0A2P5D271_TREOI|nr:hypothetical protein TorRG33x02_264980 [Trema orientale]